MERERVVEAVFGNRARGATAQDASGSTIEGRFDLGDLGHESAFAVEQILVRQLLGPHFST